MKIGVISDTHDNLEKTETAVKYFEETVDVVIHCGDIVAPFTAKLFDADFDFYAVRVNNDGEWNLKSTVQQFGKFYNNIAELEFEGLEFAVYHGTEEEIVTALLNSGEYDYVLRGHTHSRKKEKTEETVEINPGGIRLPKQEEKLHIATIDTEGDISFHEVGRDEVS